MKPLFSIIIPTFNRVGFLQRTLNSVWAQHFTDFEVIVVDDGSTDDTQKYLSSLGSRIRVLTQPNKGPGAARNIGALQALGEYVAFLDSDDLWFPWTLATFDALIQTHRVPAMLSARVKEFHGEGELSLVRGEKPKGIFYEDYLAASKTGYYVGSGMAVIKRTDFVKSGGYMRFAANAEDHDLALRLGTAHGFVQVMQPFTLAWRRHQGGLTKDVRRTFEGSRRLIMQERSQAYPGGLSRIQARREIIARHVRPVALECARRGMRNEAWELYRRTFGWQCSLGRWKFLLGFPLKSIFAGKRSFNLRRG